MAKFSIAILAAVMASASAFVSQKQVSSPKISSLNAADAADGVWDPMGFSTLADGEAFDTFPNVFPKKQFLQAAEIKHGRQAMLGWTGVWATHEGGFGLGLHFPGFPNEPDWTKALGTFAVEQPIWFGSILGLIAIAEGESVGHSGDNFRGMSTKTDQGDLNFDIYGLKKKFSAEKYARYQDVEMKNGRAAMIAMASLFAFESIPGSVPIMDLLGAQ